MNLYNNIANVLSKSGIKLAVGSMYDYMEMWKEWYAGDVQDFHHYSARLADGKIVSLERLTMNMPKKICEDVAKLLWTEKTEIQLESKGNSKALWKVLDNKTNNFSKNFPVFLEKVLALGNGVLIEYKDNGNTTIDYVPGDLFIPYKYTNSYIYGIITISRFTEIENPDDEPKSKTTYFTHITYHEYEDGKYKTKHELYKSNADNELGKEVEDGIFSEYYPNLKKEDEIETDVPYFQVVSLNLANNLDMSSPLSVSLFANSIDRFKSIDTKYDSFMNEFKLGKKRILVDSSTLKAKATPDEKGNIQYVRYFDTEDQVYVAVEGMEKQPAKEIDFSLRTNEHITAINSELNWLSDNVGLGTEWYQFNGSGVKTATEVISENSKAFRTREHLLTGINDVVIDLVKAVCKLEGIESKDITITPDDSIIVDKNTERTMDLMEVQQGLMSKETYLKKNKGLSEKQAKDELAKIDSEKMSNQELFGFPTEENPDNTPQKAKEENDKKIEEK